MDGAKSLVEVNANWSDDATAVEPKPMLDVVEKWRDVSVLLDPGSSPVCLDVCTGGPTRTDGESLLLDRTFGRKRPSLQL